MHIPDGFLDTATLAVTWVASAGSVAYAVRRVSKERDERQVPLMGVSAAFIFAAQMLNFTVAGGTSGHLLGGALAAILLGPWAGMLVITSVLAVQALLFQDGGRLALGANILNMAVIGVLLAWVVYAGVKRLSGNKNWGTMAGGFAAAWLSVVLASLVTALELAISGASPWGVVLPAMEPQILVLDEPSAGLDPRTRRNLIRLLCTLPQTMLVASHEMRLVWELCPRTVIMDGGQIVADGATVELPQDAVLMECHRLETPFQVMPQAEICPAVQTTIYLER